MMVTFVSECEKKALNRTRRVLDSFAGRIGSGTWQTVITAEGLQAVKKLLRKTATKNTAVSCHWIRSRRRTELMWIVGNRRKFNSQGFVPVNFTNTTEVIMDEIQIKTDKLFANTKRQPLVHHLFAVGYLAYATINRLIDNEKLSTAAFIAGCLHDLGKIDPGFQTWVSTELKKKKTHEVPEEGQHIDKKTGTFSFEKHPRHNEISLLLYHLLNDEKYVSVNKPTKDIIRHTLYWHHAKPIRKEEFKSLDTVCKKLKNNIGNNGFTTLIHTVKQIVMAINGLAEEYFADDPETINGILDYFNDDRIYELGNTPLPEYKRYNQNDVIKDYRRDITLNAKSNLCRAAVVSSDRLVSSIDGEALNNFIEERRLDTILDESMIQYSKLDQQVQKCINGFVQRDLDHERNQAQKTAASQLTEVEHVGVLKGPAGCGKTKIALEWALNTRAKKIIWICPRVQVCQGLIRDLTGKEYLPDTKIELNTGEFKTIYHAGNETETPEGEEFSGDIVITTIDQVINTITTHTKITSLSDSRLLNFFKIFSG